MITIKLPVTINDELKNYIKQYNSVVRFAYNRFVDRVSTKDIKVKIKSLNNVSLVDLFTIDIAIIKAQEIFKLNKDNHKVIFGGKKNFFNRMKGLITKEEFNEKKNIPMILVGAANMKGNRKFDFDIINNNRIIFKPNKKSHFNLVLPKLNKYYKKYLYLVEEKATKKEIPVTIGFDYHNIFITFDEIILKDEQKEERKVILDRILAIDMNPNYTGLSIIDYDANNNPNLVYKEIISIKDINDIDTRGLPSTDTKNKYKNNKRKHEVFEISKHIIKLALHYQVETLAIEKLSIKSVDYSKGKNYNRRINNQWNRVDFVSNLKKRCRINNIFIHEVLPQFSSFIGQLNNPKEVDSIAASMEISRRANLFNKIYKKKTLVKQNIVFPEFNIGRLLENHRKKDLGENINNIKSWRELYNLFKKSKLSYRFLYDDLVRPRVLSLLSFKSLVTITSV